MVPRPTGGRPTRRHPAGPLGLPNAAGEAGRNGAIGAQKRMLVPTALWLIYDEADPRQAALIRIGAVSLLRGGGRLGRPVRRLAVVPLISSAAAGPGCRCGAPGDSINQSARQRRP
jgi:hypothetical protein